MFQKTIVSYTVSNHQQLSISKMQFDLLAFENLTYKTYYKENPSVLRKEE